MYAMGNRDVGVNRIGIAYENLEGDKFLWLQLTREDTQLLIAVAPNEHERVGCELHSILFYGRAKM